MGRWYRLGAPSNRVVGTDRRPRRDRTLAEVALDEEDGMPRACVLNFDNLVVMPKSWFVEPICELPTVRMVQACRALAVALGC
jgi:mRNA-degrading endonuclease toxin of MazEF toxin-antitoxin module